MDDKFGKEHERVVLEEFDKIKEKFGTKNVFGNRRGYSCFFGRYFWGRMWAILSTEPLSQAEQNESSLPILRKTVV